MSLKTPCYKLIACTISLLTGFVFAQETVTYKGVYQGKNVYVQNPVTSIGFCVSELRINKRASTTKVNTAAFEIKLKEENLNVGDTVELTFQLSCDCKPKILNPEFFLSEKKPREDEAEIELVHREVYYPDGKIWKVGDFKGNDLINGEIHYYSKYGFKTKIDFLQSGKKMEMGKFNGLNEKEYWTSYYEFLGLDKRTKHFLEDSLIGPNDLIGIASRHKINQFDSLGFRTGFWWNTIDDTNSYLAWNKKEMDLIFAKEMKFPVNCLGCKDYSYNDRGFDVNVDIEKKTITKYKVDLFNSGKNGSEKTSNKTGQNEYGFYFNSLKHGRWVNLDSSGKYVTTIVEYFLGRPKGVFQSYYSNGNLQEVGYWISNHYEGSFTRFHENGNIAQIKTFNANGKTEGLVKYYWPNGIVELIFLSKNGVENGFLMRYDSLGLLTEMKYCEYGDCKDTSIFTISSEVQALKDIVNFENSNVQRKRQLIETQSNLADEKIITESRRKTNTILVICVIFAGLFLVIITITLMQKNKANKRIKKQRQEIEQQHILLEEKHHEITDSINYAERLQRSLMANKKLLDENLNDYFVYFNPKEAVSGDFYWACKLENENFVLVCADSTGHGVPGSIMSMMNMNSLKESVKEGCVHSDEILNHTRTNIIQTLANDGTAEGGKDGMDAVLLIFNKYKSELEFSLANNPLWLIRNHELIEFKADKMPVGKHDKQKIPFTRQSEKLQKGDLIYIFTDGFADQFGGEKGKKFKYASLKELFLSVADKNMEEQKTTIAKTFENWRGNLEQVDDVCVIGVRV